MVYSIFFLFLFLFLFFFFFFLVFFLKGVGGGREEEREVGDETKGFVAKK